MVAKDQGDALFLMDNDLYLRILRLINITNL